MSYTELTVWTRGIIMDEEGRDIVNSISASARIEGKYAQAMGITSTIPIAPTAQRRVLPRE